MIARDLPAPLLPDAPRTRSTGEPVHLNLAHAYALLLALRADGLGDIAAEIEQRIAAS